MAKTNVIHCQDCGAPRLTRWKNTKYCFICRLIRNLDFLSENPSKCLVCDSPFTPLKRGDDLCGKCDDRPMFAELVGKCAFCEEDGRPLIAPHVAICKECAKTPSKRKQVKKALLLKQQKIKSGEIEIPAPEIPAPKPPKPKEEVPKV